jgi:PKD repeat protein
VTVQAFTNVGAISLVLNFNPLKLEYQGVTPDGFTPQVTPGCPFPGQFRLGWYGSPLTLIDGSALLTLHFTLLPGAIPGDTTNIKWSQVPEDCEYAGPNGNPTYISTFVDLTPPWTIPNSTLAANFTASNTTPVEYSTVVFTDLTTGSFCPTSWIWSFDRASFVVYVNGTGPTSQNPQVQFTVGGLYTVTLVASNAYSTNTDVKTGYIRAGIPGLWTGAISKDWDTDMNWDNWLVPTSSINVVIPSYAPNWPLRSSDLTLGDDCHSVTMNGASQATITGNLTVNSGSSLTINDNGILFVGGNWTNSGSFSAGTGTVEFVGANASIIGGSPNIFYNLTISKTDPATFTVPNGITITVDGDMTINQ